MQVYDLINNKEIAKKSVLKDTFKIDTDSAVVTKDRTIVFILNDNN